MEDYQKLLLLNKAWVQDKLELDEHYFEELAVDQHPKFLWVGCSDSRVPANEITGTDAGDMFVHRNIANLIVPDDLNMLSVVQYAVEVLKVKHVIVCGHYECGGVKTAMTDKKLGLIDQWIQYIKDVKDVHHTELEAITDEQARFDRLVELNVEAQIHNLVRTNSVQKMWQSDQQPTLHGWVFNMRTGLIKEVLNLYPDDQMVLEGRLALEERHE